MVQNIFSKTQKFKKQTKETWKNKSEQDKQNHINAIKQTKKEKYGDENYCNSKKALETNLRNHDGIHSNKTKEVREKITKTCKEKYNTDIPSKSYEVKQKILETHINRYGGIGFQVESIKHKAKQTMENKYGNESFTNPEQKRKTYIGKSEYDKKQIRLKASNTCIERYGIDNAAKLKEFQDKAFDTKLKIYGNGYFNNREKSSETCIERYGVCNYSQTHEFHEKCHKKYTNSKYPDMTFGSSWEFLVYDFLKEHNISFEYQCKPISYEYDGKKYYYIPDFLINGKIYEVKGDQFFKINESTGKEEMFCPYRYDWWTDEYYQWRCGKEEAKHQCMLNNDVIILRDNDIKNINLDTFKILHQSIVD